MNEYQFFSPVDVVFGCGSLSKLHTLKMPEQFCRKLSSSLGKEIGTGEFGADMKVELLNDGPVTICIDTKNKE